ncbi:MAG: hypothetical protein CYPHOPRED_005180 [Cyphobasidiales sp. Tagirdzhanova-0007]|nr:MAG: hypothetical protein CYPHOPRED_005180 [Cyphobasidiales sp. Tagirdzhanova-0007]
MAGPPSTLRTAPHNDPSHQSLDEQVSPSLQQLIRLQIFTPLCLLVALGCNLVTVFAFHPNVGEINDDFETIWTAKKELVGGYLLLMYVLQICYCLVITLAKSPATRELVVNGVGLRFCLANIFQGLWSVFWILRLFLVSEIFLLLAGFTMLTVWATLLRYPASYKHPIDWLFIHVPVRMFLLFLLNLAIWQNGLIALNWYKYNGSEPDRKGKWEKEHDTHAWIAFGVITGLGLIDSFIVFLSQDFAWAASCVFLFVAIILGSVDKPVQVVIPLILVSSLQVVALLASYTWALYDARRKGSIRLPADDDDNRSLNSTA